MRDVLLYGELTQLSILRYDYLATDSQYLLPFSMVFPVANKPSLHSAMSPCKPSNVMS